MDNSVDEELIENVIISGDKNIEPYDIAYKTHTILVVLTFTVIVVFMYRYLRSVFSK